MTLVLALPASDGVALVSDTRKWFRTGGHTDGHHKLVSSRDGLLTGTGSGQLLDYVAAQASDRFFSGAIALISRVARCGVWDLEIADWTLTGEHEWACPAEGDHGVGIAVYDGFAFKRNSWEAGSVPAGLPPLFIQRAHTLIQPILMRKVKLCEVRSVVFDVYSDLHESGLLSRDFDFGTHRPQRRLNIERLCVSRGPVNLRAHMMVGAWWHRKSRSSPAGRSAA